MYLSLVLALLNFANAFAGQGVASGGGGGEQVPTLEQPNPGVLIISCPGMMETVCSSQMCTDAAASNDELTRAQFLSAACEELKSK